MVGDRWHSSTTLVLLIQVEVKSGNYRVGEDLKIICIEGFCPSWANNLAGFACGYCCWDQVWQRKRNTLLRRHMEFCFCFCSFLLVRSWQNPVSRWMAMEWLSVVVQSLSRAQLWDPTYYSTPGSPLLHNLPEFAQIHVLWVSEAIEPSHSLPPLYPFSFFPSIRDFSNKLALPIRWPKYWSFSFSISPSNEYWGLIFFKKWLVCSPCSPKDSQGSPPTPQFESINFLALSLLYGPTLTSIHDYWKNHSFDYADRWQQSDIFAF